MVGVPAGHAWLWEAGPRLGAGWGWMRLWVGRTAEEDCLRGRTEVTGGRGLGSGPSGGWCSSRHLSRPTRSPRRAERGARAVGLGFRLLLSPGRLRCLVVTGPVNFLCLPPALLSPGVHVPSSLPSLKSVSTVTCSMRPLLTTLPDVSTPTTVRLSLCLCRVVFPGALVPSHDRIYVAETGQTDAA